MVGWENRKLGTTLGGLLFVVSQGTSREALWIPGRRLPEITSGYKKEDIWNMDEVECFGGLCLIQGAG